MSKYSAVAVCLPGLEEICEAELRALGIKKTHAFKGGVNFTCSPRQLYAINVWLRTATRVLVRVARFDAFNWDEMTSGLDMVDWDDFLAKRQAVRLRVSSSASRLYHTDGIGERVAKHLGVKLADEADLAGVETEHQLLVVRVSHNQFTVSVDTSGEALHRRGWRQAVAKAPLRETVAAALLITSGWQADTPLFDPFCGSGTVAIEAARTARGIAPGADRSFAFQNWPSFAPGTWASVNAEIGQTATDVPLGVTILGSDRDAGAIQAAEANAERAGVAGDVTFIRQSVSEATAASFAIDGAPAPSVGSIVTNPPYGIRIQGGDMRNLYARLGQVARQHFAGWNLTMLGSDPRTAGHSGVRLNERFVTKAGAHAITCLSGSITDDS